MSIEDFPAAKKHYKNAANGDFREIVFNTKSLWFNDLEPQAS